jgi:hypothetical protein
MESGILNELKEFPLIHEGGFEHLGMGGSHGARSKTSKRNGAHMLGKKTEVEEKCSRVCPRPSIYRQYWWMLINSR